MVVLHPGRRQARRALRVLVDPVLAGAEAPRVVTMVRGADAEQTPTGGLTGLVAAAYPDVEVHPVRVDVLEWRIFGQLAGLGPIDLLIDDAGDPDLVERFSAYFRLLRSGGRYLVEPQESHLTDFIADLGREERDRSTDAVRRIHPGEVAALAEAVGRSTSSRRHLAVTRQGWTLAKVREPEMNEALRAVPGRGRVVATVAGTTLEPQVALRDNVPTVIRKRAEYVAPDLFLREYHDVVCMAQGIVVQHNILTPDTYRHHQALILKHKAMTNVGARAVVPPFDLSTAAAIAGAYYHLDNEARGHFGHVMTEQVSRLWGYEQARALEPDLKVLIGAHRGRPLATWEQQLLTAGGIDLADVVLVSKPTRVERMYAATPMFSMPDYAHTRLVETWDRLSQGLVQHASPDRVWPDRLFVSRRHDKRACSNRLEVEALFAEHGFEVVYPEEHALPDQAAMFSRAEVVAGFAGSGMFSLIFADRPKHVILIGSTSYRASNEYMISALRGHRLDISTSQDDPDQPENRWTRRSFGQQFTFDMTREGAWVRGVLADL